MLDGAVDDPGVHPPEDFADQPEVLEALFVGLKQRGVVYTETSEAVGQGN